MQTGASRGTDSVTTTFKALSHPYQAAVVNKTGQNRGIAMCNRPKRDWGAIAEAWLHGGTVDTCRHET